MMNNGIQKSWIGLTKINHKTPRWINSSDVGEYGCKFQWIQNRIMVKSNKQVEVYGTNKERNVSKQVSMENV